MVTILNIGDPLFLHEQNPSQHDEIGSKETNEQCRSSKALA
jgi:hypothetical protein